MQTKKNKDAEKERGRDATARNEGYPVSDAFPEVMSWWALSGEVEIIV